MSGVPLAAALYLAFAAVAIVFFGVAMGFPGPLSPGDIGPAMFPQAIAVALVALVALELLAVRSGRRTLSWSDLRLALAVPACTLIAILLMGQVGFFVVHPPVLFGGLWLLGERRLPMMLGYSIGFTAFIWLFFFYALGEPISGFGT